jgi:hypothetical protein
MGLAYPVATDHDFTNLRQSAMYSSRLKAFEKNKTGKHPSTHAFKLAEKDLIPEKITYDPQEKICM